MQRVELTQDFALPVERVFSYLAEHTNLEPIFGAKITRVRDGKDEPNGVGSVRRLKIGPLAPLEETITAFVRNELIEYKITKGSPLKDHVGTMRFAPTADGSRLHYVIEFGAKVPGLDRIVKVGLSCSISRNLPKVDQLA